MLSLEINVKDEASPHLQRALAGLQNTRPLMQKVGEELARAIREHFTRRDSQPNARGWPKRHFWSQEGRRNTALSSVSQNEAVVTIASAAIAHKLHGGTVHPKRARALAIPASAEAYRAIQPSAMNKNLLSYIQLRTGTGLVGMLVERQHTTLRRLRGRYRQTGQRGGKVWFWLVSQATHRPDPDTLPPESELRAITGAATGEYIATLLPRQ